MRKGYIVFLMATVAWWSTVQGQTVESIDVDYQEVGGEAVQVESQRPLRRKAGQVESGQTKVNQTSPGVLIYNNTQTASASNQTQGQLQAQPTTYVEAAPLVDSRADQLRRTRQGAEVQTEQRIVEKLEESRLDDERQRSERLFGDRWSSLSPKPAPPAAPQPEAAPVVLAPAPAPAPAPTQYLQPIVQIVPVTQPEEVQESSKIREELPVVETDSSDDERSYYLSPMIGVSDYSEANNVEGNGAIGVALGMTMYDQVSVEASLLYSNFYVNEWWKYDFFKELDQYNMTLGAKYHFFSGSMFRPYLGGAGSYVYRNYNDRTSSSYYSWAPKDREVSSKAFDFIFSAGFDVNLTRTFALGFDLKRSWNLFSRSESELVSNRDWWTSPDIKPIEEMGYSVISVTARMTF